MVTESMICARRNGSRRNSLHVCREHRLPENQCMRLDILLLLLIRNLTVIIHHNEGNSIIKIDHYRTSILNRFLGQSTTVFRKCTNLFQLILLVLLVCSEPKPKHTNGVDLCAKKWQIFLITTIIILICAALGISIYALVASKTMATMTGTNALMFTTSKRSCVIWRCLIRFYCLVTTTTTTTAVLPIQCSSYSFVNDPTRLATAAGGSASDISMFSSTYVWYRFYGSGGTQIVTTTPAINRCGTVYPGWYASAMPNYGDTVIGTVCYAISSTSICRYSNLVLVTNCGSYYVYGLIDPPAVSTRYCTV